MSGSRSNVPSNSDQNPGTDDSGAPLKFSDQLPLPPELTSHEADWASASLEYHDQPPGETPKLCLDHYVIGLFVGSSFQLEHSMDEVAQGLVIKDTYTYGGTTLIPMGHTYWGRWRQQTQAFMINLNPDLLTRYAAELLSVNQVELLPKTQLYDPLILQVALTLKADIELKRPGGRLYAETLTSALAVHLARNYASHQQKSVRAPGGVAPS